MIQICCGQDILDLTRALDALYRIKQDTPLTTMDRAQIQATIDNIHEVMDKALTE